MLYNLGVWPIHHIHSHRLYCVYELEMCQLASMPKTASSYYHLQFSLAVSLAGQYNSDSYSRELYVYNYRNPQSQILTVAPTTQTGHLFCCGVSVCSNEARTNRLSLGLLIYVHFSPSAKLTCRCL
jgi:hypothetical protein